MKCSIQHPQITICKLLQYPFQWHTHPGLHTEHPAAAERYSPAGSAAQWSQCGQVCHRLCWVPQANTSEGHLEHLECISRRDLKNRTMFSTAKHHLWCCRLSLTMYRLCFGSEHHVSLGCQIVLFQLLYQEFDHAGGLEVTSRLVL